jgi:hypothetical protein
MITFKIDNQNEAIISTNQNGLATLQTTSHPESISQNVKLRMLIMRQLRDYEPEQAIDWLLFFNDRRLRPLLGTKIRSLIADTSGVESVNLSAAEYDLNPPRFTGICFTVGCENQEISL